MTDNNIPPNSFYARNRSEWRQWLEENHSSVSNVWLIYTKKASGQPSVSYDEAVEEALCFGWVDSRPNALDDERYMQLFSPRKPKSPWSRLNKQRVEKLIQHGLMMNSGMEKISGAKLDGSWDAWEDIEDLEIPLDLQEALDGNKPARDYFMAFPPSSKKNILWWIKSAKKPETRAKRVEETVTLAAQNIKANHYRQ